MNVMYDNSVSADDQGQTSAPDARSRSPATRGAPSQGIQEQQQLDPAQQTSIYGLGSRMLVPMGWVPNPRLGNNLPADRGTSSALTSEPGIVGRCVGYSEHRRPFLEHSG